MHICLQRAVIEWPAGCVRGTQKPWWRGTSETPETREMKVKWQANDITMWLKNHVNN